MSAIAIVPSAGLGVRFGPGRDKPFALLRGRPLLAWAIEALEASDLIAGIIPVLNGAAIEAGREALARRGFPKVQRIVTGGAERQHSVMNALRSIPEEWDGLVLVHDGARPFLDQGLIRRAIEGVAGFDGAAAAVPPKDTIKEVDGEGIVARTPARSGLRAVQTPQVFPYRTLLEAYERASAEGFIATDDSALVERMGGRVRLVEGSYTNIKITTPEDLDIAETLIERGYITG